jgi:hypothetical protein
MTDPAEQESICISAKHDRRREIGRGSERHFLQSVAVVFTKVSFIHLLVGFSVLTGNGVDWSMLRSCVRQMPRYFPR